MREKTRSLLRSLCALLLAVVIVLALPFSSFRGGVNAEGETEYPYTINGYNSSGIVQDSEGNYLPGKAYCLDFKSGTPSGQKYKRVKLSELDSYDMGKYGTRVLTDNVKARLSKLMYYTSDVEAYLRAIDNTAELDWFLEYNRLKKEAEQGVDDHTATDASSRVELTEKEKSDYTKEFYTGWSDMFDNYTTTQRLLWCVVHDDSEWGTFIADSNINGHEDNYYWSETSTFYYVSDDPVSDPHSLWNLFYVNGINYLDSLPDPRNDGYDVWVYICQDGSKQNILGVVFQDVQTVKISKVDITSQQELVGAHLQVIDESDNVVDEWDSDKDTHEVTGLIPGRTYTIRETVAPNGYKVTTDVTFSVDKNGNVTTTASTSSSGVILVEDSLTKVKISKKAVSGKDELPGATLTLTGKADWDEIYDRLTKSGRSVEKVIGDTKDSNGKTVKVTTGIKWVSTSTALEIEGLLYGEEYTLTEETAPKGYLKAENIKFKFDETVSEVVMYDKEETKEENKTTESEKKDTTEVKTTEATTEVTTEATTEATTESKEEQEDEDEDEGDGSGNLIITILDEETKRPVPNATVTVTNPDGSTGTYTTNENGQIILKDIPEGDYKVTVTKVPDGYTVTEGKTQTVNVEKNKTKRHTALITTTDVSKPSSGPGPQNQVTTPDAPGSSTGRRVTTVKTGDVAMLLPVIITMLISLGMIFAILLSKKKIK